MQTAVDYKNLYEQKAEEVAQLQYQVASLTHQLKELQRLIFGSRHEKFIPAESQHPLQLNLGIEAETIAQGHIASAKKIEYTRTTTVTENKKDHPGRMKFPEHLERIEIILEPEQKQEDAKKIGEEITEELEYAPGKIFVNRYIRPKYTSTDKATIVIAPMPSRPLPKAIAGAGLLTQIVIDKYVDHLPLYRQQERFKREGINVPYSTISDWVANTCKLIDPLYEALKKLIMQSGYLHADETPVKVLDKDKKGETHRGYFWAYHNSIDGLLLFDYQPGRGREGPHNILKEFNGHLQTDGYAVYDFFKDKEEITVLHCMAHARRKFYEALDNDKSRAEYALQQFGLLYDIERKAKQHSLTAEQLLQLRQSEARPLLERLGAWMKEQYMQVLPKSVIGKALGYSIERWAELMIYTTDAKLNIDNNPVENSIRPIAIGRKNYLFAGSHEAAQRSAMLYSLLGTCKLHQVNPFLWLKDVLQRINDQPINKVAELLPHIWKPA
jgi:transposase